MAYWSRRLQKSEKSYSTIEREAVVSHFYPYLYGHDFTLFTDHNPLTSLKDLKDTGGPIARWILFLQQFQFTFSFRPGRFNVNADVMSRISQQSVSAVFSLDLQSLHNAQRQDPSLSVVISAIQSGKSIVEPHIFARQINKLFLKDDVLCRTYQHSSVVQVVVPLSMRHTILQQLHDSGGHFGVAKTLNKVKERFYWPGYEVDVEQWVSHIRGAIPHPMLSEHHWVLSQPTIHLKRSLGTSQDRPVKATSIY